jgi:hypothetical protein
MDGFGKELIEIVSVAIPDGCVVALDLESKLLVGSGETKINLGLGNSFEDVLDILKRNGLVVHEHSFNERILR